MSPALDVRILWCLCTALQSWIAFRILRGHLGQTFKNFGIYLAVASSSSFLLAFISAFSDNRNLYGYSFVFWTYAASIFEFLVIRELTSNALLRFPAIRAASSFTLFVFGFVLVGIGIAWFLYLNSLGTQRTLALLKPALRYQQSVALGFTLFIFIFLAFLAWMPVPLSRNLIHHSFLMGALFLVVTLSRFSTELGNYVIQQRIADYIGIGGTLVVLLVWNTRIRSIQGDELSTPKGPIKLDEAAVLISRLEELNHSLSRSGPKVLK